MITRDEAEQVVAEQWALGTATGGRLGHVVRIFLDEYTGWPSFATVDLDQRSGDETFVALHEAELGEDHVLVPYRPELVLDAPRVSADRDLTAEEENDLFDYYGVPIEGVLPSVAHLGRVMALDGDSDDGVVDKPRDQPGT